MVVPSTPRRNHPVQAHDHKRPSHETVHTHQDHTVPWKKRLQRQGYECQEVASVRSVPTHYQSMKRREKARERARGSYTTRTCSHPIHGFSSVSSSSSSPARSNQETGYARSSPSFHTDGRINSFQCHGVVRPETK